MCGMMYEGCGYLFYIHDNRKLSFRLILGHTNLIPSSIGLQCEWYHPLLILGHTNLIPSSIGLQCEWYHPLLILGHSNLYP